MKARSSTRLFPPTATDTTTVMGAAENAGDITTKDMSTFLFPNVFLFNGSTTIAASSASIPMTWNQAAR